MQVLWKRFSVIGGFCILVVLLISGTVITQRRVAVQVSDHYWVAHTRQVLFELESCESLLKDAETGQRGFLYTGDQKYLTPYNEARTQIESALQTIARLVADNPSQSAAVSDLRNLSHAKLAELQETIDLAREGKPDDAKAVVLSNRGLALMNHIREVIDSMEARETTLEAERAVRYEKNAQATIEWIYAFAGIAIAGLALLAYFILRDMQLREQHNEDIRQREEWFRTTLTSIGDAVIATDHDGKVTFLNPVAEKLTGFPMQQALNRSIHEVFPIFNEFTGLASESPVAKVIERGTVVGLANHTVLQHADGHRIPIEDSAAPICNDKKELIGVVLVFHDVTSERKSQELLRKSEKLAAAARLSATVAHEINNPLEAVCNLIYIAKLAPDLPSGVAEQLTMAEHELARVAHITRQTLGFYRESTEPQPIEIVPILDSVLTLYSSRVKTKNIKVRCEFGECPPVIGVPGELRQAIANLFSNAVDAVQDNGTISITLGCVRELGVDEIQLLVEDDGPGIPKEHLQTIFEPFFTTKKDIGTGLGLYVTREILERHGGTVTVRENGHTRSGEGRNAGACFVLRLPCDMDPHARESIMTKPEGA
ncbi:PAS domain S-box protein [Acidobacteria bacterium AB60]|nr:PAS domain S-box protein [Acidobacteria bacterium AB60]